MRLVTPAVPAGQTNSVSSSQAAEEHENLYVFSICSMNKSGKNSSVFSSLAAENERFVRAVGKADFMQYLDFLAALVVLER